MPLLACFLTAPGPALDRLSPARLLSRLTGGRTIELGPRWRAAAVALVIPFAVWQWAPSKIGRHLPVERPGAAPELLPAPRPELTAVAPGPIRVEIPPTLEHWEAAFVAPARVAGPGLGAPARHRQQPHLLHRPGALTPASYQAWLDANGVTWVALPTAPLDYAAQAEARLLASGEVPGLDLVWVTPQWQLWQVDQPGAGQRTGPADDASFPTTSPCTVAHPGGSRSGSATRTSGR